MNKTLKELQATEFVEVVGCSFDILFYLIGFKISLVYGRN